MIYRLLSIIIITGFCSTLLRSQSNPLDNRRQLIISTAPDSVFLDSLNVIPRSVKFISFNRSIPLDSLRYTLEGNWLHWSKKPEEDTVLISFRVLSNEFSSSLAFRDPNKIAKDAAGNYIGFDYSPFNNPDRPLFDSKGLDYSGSFSRGLSFGNSQNLVLNSSFNLQMNGQLGDDVEILAAISDNNIPIQPEGNTQQLQEFDRIFIQLSRKNSRLLAGDYELSRPSGHFINYFKKLQGATFFNNTQLDERSSLSTKASVAIARGKFSRNEFVGQEGNQGPYRLRGENDEAFIIVLAGTEKVYMDGERLQRGLEYDYVIDYNRGDITFTNKRLITKDIRIIVEFEYSNQQYLRSMFALSNEWKQDKLSLYFNFFSEQDDKNSGEARDFTVEQKQSLAEAGDNTDGILVSGERPVSETQEQVQYLKIDNPYTPFGDSILVPVQLIENDLSCTLPIEVELAAQEVLSTNPSLLAVSFSKVDPGLGNYNRCSEAFGTVFVYSPPDSLGNPTGEFLPIIKLNAPRMQQMISLGTAYEINEKGRVSAEISMSNFDFNRFSQLDEEDDQGLAVKVAYQQAYNLSKKEDSWQLNTQIDYEGLQSNFRFLNPYRNAEFTRDWNIPPLSSGSPLRSEQLASGGFRLSKPKLGEFSYTFSTFQRDSLLEAYRHTGLFRLERNGYNLFITSSLTTTSSPTEKTHFFRPKLELSKTISKWDQLQFGLYGEREKNDRRNKERDTLTNESFYYDLARAFLKNDENAPLHYSASWTRRWDFFTTENVFSLGTEADQANINGRWQQSQSISLAWNFNYRELRIQQPELTNLKGQRTYLGRLDYTMLLFKGALRSSTSYEIGSGQEQKIEFVYRQIQQGEQGTHFWNNINGDDVIQLNEVELPPFPGAANLIQLPQLTDEFIRTDNVQFNQSLWLEPSMLSRNAESVDGIMAIIRKISIQNTFRIIRKTSETPGVQPWNPFQVQIPDSSLITLSSGLQSVLYYNRAGLKYDFQLGFQENRNRLTLATGPEQRLRRETYWQGRWNFDRKWSFILRLALEDQAKTLQNSELNNAVNYDLKSESIQPQLLWQPNQAFRISSTFEYTDGQNVIPGAQERLSQRSLSFEGQINQTSATSLRLNLSFVNVKYNGDPNTPVGFALLNGLQNGRNYLWTLSIDRRLANNILLNISYEGRRTGSATTVHVGRAQLRATF